MNKYMPKRRTASVNRDNRMQAARRNVKSASPFASLQGMRDQMVGNEAASPRPGIPKSPPKATPKKAPTAKPKALRIDPTPPPPAPSASSPPPSPRKKKAKKSKGYETFAPREKFAGDDTWMRHTYSKMGEVLSTGTYEQERPKLKGYEKDLLEQFTAASEENERVSKIMKARVDMSERVALTVDRQSGSMQGMQSLIDLRERLTETPQDGFAARQANAQYKGAQEKPKNLPSWALAAEVAAAQAPASAAATGQGANAPAPPKAAWTAKPTRNDDALVWRIFCCVYTPRLEGNAVPTSAAEFNAWVKAGHAEVRSLGQPTAQAVAACLQLQTDLRSQLARLPSSPAVEQVKAQVDEIFIADWITETPIQWLQEIPRFLRGAEVRLQNTNRPRDQENEAQVQRYWKQYLRLRGRKGVDMAEVTEFRWLIEELRISLFAQALGTSVTISPKRLDKFVSDMS
jgi:hypothetical protein